MRSHVSRNPFLSDCIEVVVYALFYSMLRKITPGDWLVEWYDAGRTMVYASNSKVARKKTTTKSGGIYHR